MSFSRDLVFTWSSTSCISFRAPLPEDQTGDLVSASTVVLVEVEVEVLEAAWPGWEAGGATTRPRAPKQVVSSEAVCWRRISWVSRAVVVFSYSRSA